MPEGILKCIIRTKKIIVLTGVVDLSSIFFIILMTSNSGVDRLAHCMQKYLCNCVILSILLFNLHCTVS